MQSCCVLVAVTTKPSRSGGPSCVGTQRPKKVNAFRNSKKNTIVQISIPQAFPDLDCSSSSSVKLRSSHRGQIGLERVDGLPDGIDGFLPCEERFFQVFSWPFRACPRGLPDGGGTHVVHGIVYIKTSKYTSKTGQVLGLRIRSAWSCEGLSTASGSTFSKGIIASCGSKAHHRRPHHRCLKGGHARAPSS